MKLLLISFFSLLITTLCTAQDLNQSIKKDKTYPDGYLVYETKTIRPMAAQKWTGHVRDWFGYTSVDGEITLGKDVITQAKHRGYAAFDISAIPATAVITEITLIVYTKTASISSEHTVAVKNLSIDPVVTQGEVLYNDIAAGSVISNSGWQPMTSTGYHSTILNDMGVWNLNQFINLGRSRWYVGFQETLDNDAWGKFDGWNAPGQPEPYCIVTYYVPTYIVSISPASLSFGNVHVGQNSDKLLYITNQSNVSAIYGSMSISGSGFALVGSGYFNIPPGVSMGFTVRFSPVTAGPCSGSVSILHNATNLSSPFNIPLTGTGVAASFPLSVSIANGWNMVSIPGLLPANQSVSSWWPGKDPAAGVFKFATSYSEVVTAVPGKGYWMKHLGTNEYNTGDEWPSGGILFAPHSPIPAGAGWNLIGGYEQSVPAANLTTTPSGLIISSIFSYTGGYALATMLNPGYGYWVNLSEPGSINIPAGVAGKVTSEAVSTAGFGKITITDNVQQSYTLYVVPEGNTDPAQFDLPPYPPEGMFDVRYSSQRYAENLSTPQGIEISGVEYPLTIRAAGTGIILNDDTGRVIARLSAGEEVTIPSAQKLFVSEDVIPMVYALGQNYPNPFNPATTIQFSIPEDVNNVKLIVYNALGEQIAELLNTGLQAGTYRHTWNASTLSSGMYIYKILTDKFVSTRKMILLK